MGSTYREFSVDIIKLNSNFNPFFWGIRNWCLCGNTYGKYGQVSNNQCNMACVGDKMTNCGAAWRNSVYEITSN